RGNGNKTYDQNIVGTALSWTPENWTIAAGGGWYQNFMTTKKVSVNDYFAGDAWGLEYFVGYAFPIGQYAVKAIQPYFMGDRIEY
ncbi:porin, partial [Salmonella enterica subsp. enterica serovar Montevideo]|nr:porin [Salmonella enterica subsp. enterica serovar Montevideo]